MLRKREVLKENIFFQLSLEGIKWQHPARGRLLSSEAEYATWMYEYVKTLAKTLKGAFCNKQPDTLLSCHTITKLFTIILRYALLFCIQAKFTLLYA